MCDYSDSIENIRRSVTTTVCILLTILAVLGTTERGFSFNRRDKNPENAGLTGIARHQEMIFIDPGIADYEPLLLSQGSHIDTVLLDNGSPGIVQIAEALHGRDNVRAIHVVTHGRQGRIAFQHGALAMGNLSRYRDAFREIAGAIDPDGTILLYGCNIARNEEGKKFIAAIAALTKRCVAASDDPTGAFDQGGDWRLETATGEVAASGVSGAFAASGFSGLLLESGVETFSGAEFSDGETVNTNDGNFTLTTEVAGGLSWDSSTLEVYIDSGTTGTTAGIQYIKVATTSAASPPTFQLDAITISEYEDESGDAFQQIVVAGYGSDDQKLAEYHFDAGSLDGVAFKFNDGGHKIDLSGSDFSGANIKYFTIGIHTGVQELYDFGLLSFQITITLTSDDPVLQNLHGDSLSYATGDGPVIVDQGTAVSVSDGDSANFDGGVLAISITDGIVDASEERLSLDDSRGIVELSGLTAGSGISVDDTPVGTLGNAIAAGEDLVIRLNGNANAANTAMLIGAVTYENTDTINPVPGTRTIGVVLIDGAGGTSETSSATVTVGGSDHRNFEGAVVDSGTVTTADGDFEVSTGNAQGMDRYAYASSLDEVYINDSALSSDAQNFTVAAISSAAVAAFRLDSVTFSESPADSGNDFYGNIVITGFDDGTQSAIHSFPASAFPTDFQTRIGGCSVDLNGTDFDTADIDAFTVSFTPANQSPYVFAITSFSITVTQSQSSENPILDNLHGDSLSYAKGDGGVVVDQGTAVVVTDSDSVDFDGGDLTVTISAGGADASENILSLQSETVFLSGSTAGSAVSVGDMVIGTLENDIAAGEDLVVNLNGNATAARTAMLIGAVTYENTDTINPVPGVRSIDFVLTDGDGGKSEMSGTTVAVVDAGHRNFEGAMHSGGIVTSADGDFQVSTANSEGVTTASYAAYLDEVYIDDDSATSSTQVFTVAASGAAPFSMFELDAVTFSELPAGSGDDFSDNIVITGFNDSVQCASFSFPASDFETDFRTETAGGHTVDLNGSDFDGVGIDAFTIGFTPSDQPPYVFAMTSFLIAVAPVNAAPTISDMDGDSLAYREDDVAVVIDQGTPAGVIDPDSSDFAGGTLTVTISTGEDAQEDVLSLDTGGTVALAGSAVWVGSTEVGTLDNAVTAGADLVIHLNGDADAANTAALIGAVTYENTDTGNPTAGPRTVQFTLADGDGGTSSASSATVTVSRINDPPAVAVNTGSILAEGGLDTLAASELNEGDPDDSGTGLSYTVADPVAHGTLWVDSDGSGSVNGTETALSATGQFTQSDIDNGRLRYAHDGGETLSDYFTFSLADGREDGAAVLTGQTFSIAITAVNDDPSLSGLITDVMVTEDTAGNVNLSSATLSDADSGSGSVTLTLAAGNGVLSAASSDGVAAGGSGTGTLTLTGTVAHIDAFLNTPSHIQYTGAWNASGNHADTLTLTANDAGNTGDGGGGNVSLGTVNVDIAAVNDAPEIIGQTRLNTYETAPVAITLGDLVVTDPDNTYPDGFTLTVLDGDHYTRSGQVVTPAAGFAGDLSVPVSVSDGTDDSSVFELTLHVGTEKRVENINDAGAGSLRQVLADAGDGDRIDLSGVAGTITLTSGPLAVGRDVEINGSQTDGIVIDGGGADRVIEIYAGATVTLSDLTVTNGAVADSGGGLSNSGDLTLVRVTVSGNASTLGNRGGGIHNHGTLTMKNSTVSGNSADGGGGGIVNDGILAITHCTIAANTSSTAAGGLLNTGTLSMTNTLIAGNSPTDAANTGTVAANTGNLIEDAGIPASLSGNPDLGALADNGGSTRTHGLSSGSIAVDAGDQNAAETEDQRGNARPVDGDGDDHAVADIGAFEYSPGAVEFSTAAFSTAEDDGVATIAVVRSGVGDGPVSVAYETSDGTATAGSDYTAASGTLTWRHGDTSDKTFTMAILDDVDDEPDETVNLALTGISGAGTASILSAVLTIGDNDVYCTLTMALGGEGSGSVTSSPAGIDCGSGCTAVFYAGTPITLFASPDDACTAFSGWSGGECSGTGPCMFELNGDTLITAVFDLPDSDGDGVLDCNDAFPDDPDETLDGDGDGIGDNADTDHDNDGMPTDWEVQNGLDPLVDDADLNPDNDGLTNLEEYQTGTDPRVETDGPGIPVLVSPSHAATGQALTLSLEAGYTGGADTSLHAGTRWQIALDADFTDALMDISSETHKTGITVPVGVLGPYTTCYWRVRYADTGALNWPWSGSRAFTTGTGCADEDGNGLPDDQEVGRETESDLDGDGQNDLFQADMHCIELSDGSGWTCLQNGAACRVDEFFRIGDEEIAGADGRPDRLPCGLFGFRLIVDAPGDPVVVNKYYSTPLPENVAWYKYDSINGWFDYSGFVTVGEDRQAVAIELMDGGYGDADGVANGVIVDPSGPASIDNSGGGGSGCFITAAGGDRHGGNRGPFRWCFVAAASLAAGIWRWIRNSEPEDV
ncbi:hypothetical protein DSCA_28500 [Desulfosarcina alkanivorans]|uniref:Calx-beta domain-containing protein n=1 Tax=Desulfosarcina alkanivorans TaxID=571177 RepID=A0A5K7YL59_9BACT|nr:DUF4347 domain-containing protein [Desulfosarcina alkanivorans]BBO68920.1 hypothetical protein DSCA_28500 [Desulfosarcina alkanivorans]